MEGMFNNLLLDFYVEKKNSTKLWAMTSKATQLLIIKHGYYHVPKLMPSEQTVRGKLLVFYAGTTSQSLV